jgi:hypothetical protein
MCPVRSVTYVSGRSPAVNRGVYWITAGLASAAFVATSLPVAKNIVLFCFGLRLVANHKPL